MDVRIRNVGYIAQSNALRLLGEAGKAINGPIATFGSTLPYARPIETGMRGGRMWRRAGPALMFDRGIAATLPQVPGIMLPAIDKGAASVGQAKRRVRDTGIQNIRALTPVRSGALRESVRAMERPV